MTGATLVTDSQQPAVRLERHLGDPPEVVWRSITDRDELRSWFPCDVEVSGGRWKVGATITFHFSPDVMDMTLEGQVLAVEEPTLLVYTWGEDTLRFELHPDAQGGTTLVLIDELAPESAARNAAGWEQCLDRLSEDQSDADGATYGTFLITSGGATVGGGLDTLAGYGTFSSFGEPAGSLRLVELATGYLAEGQGNSRPMARGAIREKEDPSGSGGIACNQPSMQLRPVRSLDAPVA